ncbi:hypothetical protein JCM17380_24930 [Desulfosporosinus burensis]
MGKNRVKLYHLGYDDTERLAEVDKQTSAEVAKQYSIEDEIKLIRKALASLGVNDKDFQDWNTFVEDKVAKGRDKKVQVTAKSTPVIADHDENIHKPTYPEAPVNFQIKAKRDNEKEQNKEENN